MKNSVCNGFAAQMDIASLAGEPLAKAGQRGNAHGASSEWRMREDTTAVVAFAVCGCSFVCVVGGLPFVGVFLGLPGQAFFAAQKT